MPAQAAGMCCTHEPVGCVTLTRQGIGKVTPFAQSLSVAFQGTDEAAQTVAALD